MIGRLRAEARSAEPGVTEEMVRVADEVGSSLEGLPNRLKTRISLTRKIGDRALEEISQSGYDDANLRRAITETVKDDANEINDALRYTMKFSESEYTSGIEATLSALTNKAIL